jgi:hypothetical protein
MENQQGVCRHPVCTSLVTAAVLMTPAMLLFLLQVPNQCEDPTL